MPAAFRTYGAWPEQIAERYKLLKDLTTYGSTRDAADVRQSVDALVSAKVGALRAALIRTFDSQPQAMPIAQRRTKRANRAEDRRRSGQDAARLAQRVRAMDEMPQYEAQLVPESYERVQARLLE